MFEVNEIRHIPAPGRENEKEDGQYVNAIMFSPIQQDNAMVDFRMDPRSDTFTRTAYNMGKYFKKQNINALHERTGWKKHPYIDGEIGPMIYYKANLGRGVAAPEPVPAAEPVAAPAANTRRRGRLCPGGRCPFFGRNAVANNQEGGKRRQRRHTRKSHRKHKKN